MKQIAPDKPTADHATKGRPSDAGQIDELEFPIVGIGASAGGLGAFERLFSHLSPETGIAFVVIQHLSPPHKSILPELIQRFTSMSVFQVTDGIEVKPNCVYVIPPGNNLALMDRHWHSNASKQGYASFVVLPLLLEMDPLGVLVIYAAEPDAFADPETGPLMALARGISRKLVPG